MADSRISTIAMAFVLGGLFGALAMRYGGEMRPQPEGGELGWQSEPRSSGVGRVPPSVPGVAGEEAVAIAPTPVKEVERTAEERPTPVPDGIDLRTRLLRLKPGMGRQLLKDVFESDEGKAIGTLRELLLGALRTGDSALAMRALQCLKDIGTVRAMDEIASAMLLREPEYHFPHQAMFYYTLLKDAPTTDLARASREKVIDQLEHGRENWNDLFGYSRLVGRNKESQGIEILKEMYEGRRGTSPQARMAGLLGLEETGEVSTLEYFLARGALGEVLGNQPAGFLSEPVMERLRALLASKETGEDNRAMCAKLLAEGGGEDSARALLDAWSGGHPKSAIGGLASIRANGIEVATTDRIRRVIVEALEGSDSSVRDEAIIGIQDNRFLHTVEIGEALRRLAMGEAASEASTSPGRAAKKVEATLARGPQR